MTVVDQELAALIAKEQRAYLASLCPPWAFDPTNRDQRPRTGGKWQPEWDPYHGQAPMPGLEAYVAALLTQYHINWLYEPLVAPIRRGPIRLPDPHARPRTRRSRRKVVRNDFFLTDYHFIIEVYSGKSHQVMERKLKFLQRIHELHRIPYLLVTPREEEILASEPSQLLYWIHLLLK